MTPIERYQRDLTRESFNYDAAQRQAVEHLQALYDALLADIEQRAQGRGWWQRLLGKEQVQEPVCGLYFWGGVGRR